MTNSFPEEFQKFMAGEITLGQLYGISKEEAYGVADLGHTLLEQGKYGPAEKIFRGLTATHPAESYFHSALGSVLQRCNKTDEAIREYSAAIKLDGSRIEALVNRGELLFQRGELERAAADFRRAIELDPQGSHTSGNRARLLSTATINALQKMCSQGEKDGH